MIMQKLGLEATYQVLLTPFLRGSFSEGTSRLLIKIGSKKILITN